MKYVYKRKAINCKDPGRVYYWLYPRDESEFLPVNDYNLDKKIFKVRLLLLCMPEGETFSSGEA